MKHPITFRGAMRPYPRLRKPAAMKPVRCRPVPWWVLAGRWVAKLWGAR